MSKRMTLAEHSPDIAAEWHPTKNGDLTPAQVGKTSKTKVWWLGKCGHEWQSAPGDRAGDTRHQTGCPFCAGKKVLLGFNDFATVNPELAAEWHPTLNGDLTPAQVTSNSGKTVWWKCANGHEWQAKIANRTNGNNCPICKSRKLLKGYNDLATVNPALAAEWHPTLNGNLTPAQVMPNAHKKVWWLGKCGHEWQAEIASRNGGCGCPACLKEKHTSFAEQAIFFYLNQITSAENRYLLNGKTEIDIYLPAYRIGIEYDGEVWHQDPEKDKAKNLLCERHGVRLIRVREPGCPSMPGECIVLKSIAVDALNKAIQELCALVGKTVDINIDRDRMKIYDSYIDKEKQNSLAALRPELAAEWHPTLNGNLTPAQVTSNSQKKVWWKCANGHEWQANIAHRTNQKQGCPYCSNQKVLSGYNDLATVNPEIAAEWHPTLNGELTPEQVTKCSGKKVWWLGKCGHEWQAKIADRNSGKGCPVCAGKKVLLGFNDLATVNPKLAAEWHPTLNGDLTPAQVTPNSHKKVWWKCANGHEWQSIIQDRNKCVGCPYCSGKRK